MFHPAGPTFWELARQALSATDRGYDLLAPKFDFTPFRTPDLVLQGIDRELSRFPPTSTGLDVCCGTGAGMEVLLKHCDERVVGIDFSQGMLKQAELNLRPLPNSNCCQFVFGNALSMPFEGEFDYAISLGANGHILPSDESAFFQAIFRALKPGGKFFLATSFHPSLFSLSFWLAQGFNSAMWLRNLVIRPPFVMYYLTMMLPEVEQKLTQVGFKTELSSPFPKPIERLKLLTCTKPQVP